MPSMNAGRVTRSANVCEVVAVNAGDRVLHQLNRVCEWHLIDFLEASRDVAVSRLLVRNIGGGMAIHARAGLRDGSGSLGIGLILQHVSVAAVLAEIDCESIALPHGLETGILLDLGLRDDAARVGLAGRARFSFAAAMPGALHVSRPEIELVIQREDFAPDGRVVDVIVDRIGLTRRQGDRHHATDGRCECRSRHSHDKGTRGLCRHCVLPGEDSPSEQLRA